jgi:hypothetical protein
VKLGDVWIVEFALCMEGTTFTWVVEKAVQYTVDQRSRGRGREHVKNEDGEVRVIHMQSDDQAADIFTNALSKPLFENCK